MSIHQQQVAASAKPARKTVIAALACLAFAAVGGELLLRTFVPGLGMRRYDEHFTGSRALEINQRGFRGPIPSLEAPGLVLCLGDSTTYGTGTAASDTWPMLIGAAPPNSNRLAGINAAMPGTDLSQLTRSLDENWSDLRPDCVVVALSGNMVSLAWIRREEPSSIKTHEIPTAENSPPSLSRRARYVVSDSTLVGGLLWIAESLGYRLGVNHHRIDPKSPYGALIAQGWTQAGLDPTLADQCWDELALDLKDLRDWCDRRGIPIVATWIPSRFTVSDELRDNLKFVPLDRLSIDANDRCRQMCESLSIPFADSLSAMRLQRVRAESNGDEASLYIMGDYTHLDAEGHAAVAAAVTGVLESAMSETDAASR